MYRKELTQCLLGLLLIDLSLSAPYKTAWPPLASYRKEIAAHKSVADDIIDFILSGPAKGQAYDRLAALVDTLGPRLCGSQVLEDAIDYLVAEFQKDGLDNVHKEAAVIPHWTRGTEKAELITPRHKPLAILGLGTSIGTPKEGITAEAIVVKSFDELKERAAEAKGKIVVYNQDWENYSQSGQYRTQGAVAAAKVGGVASLIRSAASFSIYSPHTGAQYYTDGVDKIPTACITVEDAELLWRMSKRGENITITLNMEAQNLDNVKSYNVIGEIQGYLYPDEVVLVSGHLDSWDVGQGAMDDGGGLLISWEALSVIHQLGLRPKRTLRVVAWTCEEFGSYGGQQYYLDHRNESLLMDIVMESDGGTFKPQGLQFTGSNEAMEIIRDLASTLLVRLNATDVDPGAGLSDVFDWPDVGVPGGSIKVDASKYFYFHHSNGDTMTVQDSTEMDLCTAVWAVTAFTLADMEYMLPANRTVKP